MRRSRGLPMVLLLAAPLLAGCMGNDGSGTDPDAAGRNREFRPCEHPWPCGDGTEWPTDLVAPDHPRQPPDIPESLTVEGAELVARTPTNATFAWRVPPAQGVQVPGAVTLSETTRTQVHVPDGLYMRWRIDLDVEGDTDGRAFDLFLLDEQGETVCFTDFDLALAGVQTEESNTGCLSGTTPPLPAPATWTLGLEHENDRPDHGDIVVTLVAEIAEPILSPESHPVELVRVPMSDGVELEGALWRPKLPEGVRAPVVLLTSPYLAQCSAQSEFQNCAPGPESATHLAGYGLEQLLQDGYAIAVFSVRGTGASGGCYDAWGPLEQRDHVELVEWLAAQPWGNGRVGMTGLSYAGTTPWEAAIHGAPGLKAIVVGGIISDVYLGGFTPQGAANDGSLYFHATTAAANSLQPARGGGDETLQRYAPVAKDRLCPDTERELLVHPEGALTDRRDAEWFSDRRLLDGFSNVTAAALVLHGVEDDNFHRFQEDVIWDALPRSPKGMVLGQWDHTIWLEEFLATYDGPGSWYEMSRVWFDFWLKGLGGPPAMLDQVAYQTTDMAWRQDAAWPPTAAHDEVLYLADGALRTEPGDGAGFRAARSPTVAGPRTGNPDLCAGSVVPDGNGDRWRVYASEPLENDVVLAGNPMAHLELASDQPGGVVSLDLYVMGPEGDCLEPTTAGAADLRFHQGNMAGRDFPVGTPTPVRLDLFSTAARVPAGHRLVVVLSGGGQDYKQGQAHYQPQVEVTGRSHLVLPLVEGSLGGHPQEMDYPARPFVPRS